MAISTARISWLLVVGSSGPGSALDMDRVRDGVYSSPFDKTMFLELHDDQCNVIARNGLTVRPIGDA
jgi:hypothetical protein